MQQFKPEFFKALAHPLRIRILELDTFNAENDHSDQNELKFC
ncbi:hypothetical protein QE429_000752 [Bacillus sp. SORGH_AS 510]|nr:hypothetical protein [Bacillus sp. SORGH_AS_0510]